MTRNSSYIIFLAVASVIIIIFSMQSAQRSGHETRTQLESSPIVHSLDQLRDVPSGARVIVSGVLIDNAVLLSAHNFVAYTRQHPTKEIHLPESLWLQVADGRLQVLIPAPTNDNTLRGLYHKSGSYESVGGYAFYGVRNGDTVTLIAQHVASDTLQTDHLFVGSHADYLASLGSSNNFSVITSLGLILVISLGAAFLLFTERGRRWRSHSNSDLDMRDALD